MLQVKIGHYIHEKEFNELYGRTFGVLDPFPDGWQKKCARALVCHALKESDDRARERFSPVDSSQHLTADEGLTPGKVAPDVYELEITRAPEELERNSASSY